MLVTGVWRLDICIFSRFLHVSVLCKGSPQCLVHCRSSDVAGLGSSLLYPGWLECSCVLMFKGIGGSCWGTGFFSSVTLQNHLFSFSLQKVYSVKDCHLFAYLPSHLKRKNSSLCIQNYPSKSHFSIQRFYAERMRTQKNNAVSFKYSIDNLLS